MAVAAPALWAAMVMLLLTGSSQQVAAIVTVEDTQVRGDSTTCYARNLLDCPDLQGPAAGDVAASRLRLRK